MGVKFWTDYPIEQLGDASGKEAPVRECKLLSYDGDKYARILVDGVEDEIKIGYIYTGNGRYGAFPSLCHAQACEMFGIEP